LGKTTKEKPFEKFSLHAIWLRANEVVSQSGRDKQSPLRAPIVSIEMGATIDIQIFLFSITIKQQKQKSKSIN